MLLPLDSFDTVTLRPSIVKVPLRTMSLVSESLSSWTKPMPRDKPVPLSYRILEYLIRVSNNLERYRVNSWRVTVHGRFDNRIMVMKFTLTVSTISRSG